MLSLGCSLLQRAIAVAEVGLRVVLGKNFLQVPLPSPMRVRLSALY
jgi:hypothetical protein